MNKNYYQLTYDFLHKCIKYKTKSFMSVDSVLREQENYIFLNGILNKYSNFPFTEWRHKTKFIRLHHLILIFGKPIISIKYLSIGWNGYGLFNSALTKRHKQIIPKKNIELIVKYIINLYNDLYPLKYIEKYINYILNKNHHKTISHKKFMKIINTMNI